MIKVAICDDDENIVNEIKELLTECCNELRIVADIYTYDKGKKLEQNINQGKCFDLLYLDIQMEEQDGIQTAKNIRKLDPNVFIIYISGYDQYIEEIFQQNTVKALSIIRDKDIFADMEMFEQDCLRNTRIMKRLTSIVLKDRLKLFFDNYDKVPEIVKENNLKIDFDEAGKIVYKDKSELYRITNLIADAYFKSLLLDRLGVAKLEGDVEE